MLAHDLSGAEIRSHRFRVTHVATALFVAAEQGPLQVQVNPVTLLRSSGGDPTWNDAYSQAGRKLLVIEPFVPVIASATCINLYFADGDVSVCNLSVGATTHWSTLQLVASRMEEGSHPRKVKERFFHLLILMAPIIFYRLVSWSRKVFRLANPTMVFV